MSLLGDAENTSRKRIEINAKLLFLLVPGRGLKLVRNHFILNDCFEAAFKLPAELPLASIVLKTVFSAAR